MAKKLTAGNVRQLAELEQNATTEAVTVLYSQMCAMAAALGVRHVVDRAEAEARARMTALATRPVKRSHR